MRRIAQLVRQWWRLGTVALCALVRYVIGGPLVPVAMTIVWLFAAWSLVIFMRAWRANRRRRRARQAHQAFREQLQERRLDAFTSAYVSGNLPATILDEYLTLHESVAQAFELPTNFGALLCRAMGQSVWLPE